MNYFGLSSLVSAVANAFACRLTSGEIALVASILVQLGDTMATIAAQKSLREECGEV